MKEINTLVRRKVSDDKGDTFLRNVGDGASAERKRQRQNGPCECHKSPYGKKYDSTQTYLANAEGSGLFYAKGALYRLGRKTPYPLDVRKTQKL